MRRATQSIFRWTRRAPSPRRVALGGLLALICSAVSGLTEPISEDSSEARPTLEGLFARFASMAGLSARFEEERHLRLLAEPLVSRGYVYFSSPDRLLRRVEAPAESALLIREGEAVLRDASGTRTLPLDLHPMLRSFVDTFGLLLAGDLAALRRSYRVEWTTPPVDDSGGWEIRLEPLVPPLRLSIAAIHVAGQGSIVRELRVIEAAGDTTRIRFTHVDTQRRFGAGELISLFDLPSP